MMKRLISVLTALLILTVFCAGASAAAEVKKCAMDGAEYVPQKLMLSDSFDKGEDLVDRTLSFVLRIEAKAGCHSTMRCKFLNFDAYVQGQKVSTMRFGEVYSMGDSRRAFSATYGQFTDESESFSPSPTFHEIGVNDDLSSSTLEEVPSLLIFPGTHWELRYDSYQVPEHWDKYIRFYTKERIYPDFRGYDFWVRRKCGNEVGEVK